jgi:hypothetical protein
MILADKVLKGKVFYGDDGDAYMTVKMPDGEVTWPLDSSDAIHYMTQTIKETEHDVLSMSDIEKGTRGALSEVWQEPKRKVFLRVGEHKGEYYLDLHTNPRRWVRFNEGGWAVVDYLPDGLHFSEGSGMLPLPEPVRSGNLGHLRTIFSRLNDAQWRVFLPMLVSYMIPGVQQPFAVCAGEQGSGKSELAKAIKRLLDDNKSLLNSAPKDAKDPRDLFIKVSSTRLPVFDNLTALSNKELDAFCLMATGGTFQTRRLYTDRQQVTIQVLNPVVVTGVTNIMPRGDAADRALLFQLRPNEDNQGPRLTDVQLEEQMTELRPKCLGALLDLTCAVLQLLRTRSVPTPLGVRITNYGSVGVAVEMLLKWPQGSFLAAYKFTREPLEQDVLQEKVLMVPLQEHLDTMLAAGVHHHVVKTADLLKQLTIDAGDLARSQFWPKSANALGKELTMCAPALRKQLGWDVRPIHTNKIQRGWEFTYTAPKAATQEITPEAKAAVAVVARKLKPRRSVTKDTKVKKGRR